MVYSELVYFENYIRNMSKDVQRNTCTQIGERDDPRRNQTTCTENTQNEIKE